MKWLTPDSQVGYSKCLPIPNVCLFSSGSQLSLLERCACALWDMKNLDVDPLDVIVPFVTRDADGSERLGLLLDGIKK